MEKICHSDLILLREIRILADHLLTPLADCFPFFKKIFQWGKKFEPISKGLFLQCTKSSNYAKNSNVKVLFLFRVTPHLMILLYLPSKAEGDWMEFSSPVLDAGVPASYTSEGLCVRRRGWREGGGSLMRPCI